MQKTISIIRGFKDESYGEFHHRLKEILSQIISKDPVELHYTVTVEKPPTVSLIPFRKEKIATISVHREDLDHQKLLEELQI